MNAYRCHSRANDIKSRSLRKHASPGAIMTNPKCEKDMPCPFTLVHRQVVIARDARWLLRERYNKVKNYERRSLAIPGRIKLRFAFVRPIRAFISRALRDARRQLSRITRIARTLLQADTAEFFNSSLAGQQTITMTAGLNRGPIRFADSQARRTRLPAASSIRNKGENSRHKNSRS